MEGILELLKPIIESFVGNYGIAIQILTIVGTCRLIFKPLVSGIRAVVDATPTKSDDEVMNKVEANVVYKWFVYALDYLASIKITKKA